VSAEKFTVNSEQTWDNFVSHARKLYDEHHYVTFGYSTGRQRTGKQRAALEVYCRLLAEELNAAGFDMIHVLSREGANIPWTQNSVKEKLWKPVQLAMLDKESTTECDRKEYSAIYDTLTRHLGQILDLPFVAWPEKREE